LFWPLNSCFLHALLNFIVLQTLRDPAARVLYDHELSQAELRATVVLHDEVGLADMDDISAPGEAAAGNMDGSCQHSYPCRCGENYVLTAADMQLAAHTQQIIIPCRSEQKLAM
jgi:hypothetical protein